MTTTTDNNQILREYNKKGYVIYRDVFDSDLIHEASLHINWLLEKNPELRPEYLGNNLMTRDPFWIRLISDDRLLDIAENFIGPDIALFTSHYIANDVHTT